MNPTVTAKINSSGAIDIKDNATLNIYSLLLEGRSWISLMIGLLSATPVPQIHKLMCSEAGLLFIAIYEIVSSLYARKVWPPLIKKLVICLILSLLAYVLTDVYNGTNFKDYSRGWSRWGFVASNIFGFVLLFTSINSIWAFTLGFGIAGVYNSFNLGFPIDVSTWKFHYCFPLSCLLICFLCFPIVSILRYVCVGGYCILSMFLDFRSFSVLLFISCIIGLGKVGVVKFKKMNLTAISIVVLICVSLLALFYTLNETQNEFRQRRSASNAIRLASIIVATEAIIDSPILGHGSWAKDTKYINRYTTVVYELGNENDSQSTENDPDPDVRLLIPAHSQVLQAAVEGGVFASIFFIAFFYFIIKTLRSIYYSGYLKENVMMLITLPLVSALWNICFSPFSGDQRLTIAWAIGILSFISILHENKFYNSKGVVVK